MFPEEGEQRIIDFLLGIPTQNEIHMSILRYVVCHKLVLVMISKVVEQSLDIVNVRKCISPSKTEEKRNVFWNVCHVVHRRSKLIVVLHVCEWKNVIEHSYGSASDHLRQMYEILCGSGLWCMFIVKI